MKYMNKLFLLQNKKISLFLYFLTFTYFCLSFFDFLFRRSFLYAFKNSWSFSEYFINYSGGFVRRGLIGSMFQFLSQKLTNFHDEYNVKKVLQEIQIEFQFMTYENVAENIGLLYVTFVVSVISILHIAYFVFKKIQNYTIVNLFLFLLSPFGIFHFIQNLEAYVGRKDLLILNFIIYYKEKKNLKKYSEILTLFSIGVFLSLSYELFLFFLVAVWHIVTLKDKKKKTVFNLSLLIIFLINIILILKFSVTKNFSAFKSLCDDIYIRRIALRLDELQCWGAPRYLDSRNTEDQTLFSQFFTEVYLNIGNSFLNWIYIFILMFLMFYLFDMLHLKNAAIFSPFLLLFVFAQDFGRWFFLLFLLLVIFGKEPSYKSSIYKKISAVLIIISGFFIKIPTYLGEQISFDNIQNTFNDLIINYYFVIEKILLLL